MCRSAVYDEQAVVSRKGGREGEEVNAVGSDGDDGDGGRPCPRAG